MLSYKKEKIPLIKIEDDSNNNNKNKYDFKKFYISENKIKSNLKKIYEKDKSNLNGNEKLNLSKKTNSNHNIIINLKQNNSILKKNANQNIENISKNKYSNNSSDLLNKSILTTSNSEIKYGKKINLNSNNFHKTNYLITNINDNMHNNNSKKLETEYRIKTEEKNESNDSNSKDSQIEERILNYKQMEKLKKLKYLIFTFDRKEKTIGKNSNNVILNEEKGKTINFCRESKINKFIPSFRYNKNNIYLNKKLILKNNNNYNKDSLISNSLRLKILEYNNRNVFSKKNKKLSNETPRTTSIGEKARIKLISKYNLNNAFITNENILNKDFNLNKRIRSSIGNQNEKQKQKKEKDFFKFCEKRCKSSHKINKYSIFNFSKILKDEYSKTLLPMTKRLITESNKINHQISKERKDEKLMDYFGEDEMKNIKINKKPLDLKKIRKGINLYNVKSYFNETNIIKKGTKRIEKLLTSKKEVNLARSVAQKVINEDILLNNYFDFDATYNIRMKRLIERRLYTKFAGFTALTKKNMKIDKNKKTDRERLLKILKKGIENYSDKKSLKYLMFKCKAINIKRGKKLY